MLRGDTKPQSPVIIVYRLSLVWNLNDRRCLLSFVKVPTLLFGSRRRGPRCKDRNISMINRSGRLRIIYYFKIKVEWSNERRGYIHKVSLNISIYKVSLNIALSFFISPFGYFKLNLTPARGIYYATLFTKTVPTDPLSST